MREGGWLMTIRDRVLAACYGAGVLARRAERRAEEDAIAKPLQARVNALAELGPSMRVVSDWENDPNRPVGDDGLPLAVQLPFKIDGVPSPRPEGASVADKRNTNGDF